MEDPAVRLVQPRAWIPLGDSQKALPLAQTICDSCMDLNSRLQSRHEPSRTQRPVTLKGVDKIQFQDGCVLCDFFAEMFTRFFPTLELQLSETGLVAWPNYENGLFEIKFCIPDIPSKTAKCVFGNPKSSIAMFGTDQRQNSYTMTKDTTDFEKVRHWLSQCDGEHVGRCNKDENGNFTIPHFKVIDCDEMSIVSTPSSTPYVTLSYVWGSSSIGTFPSHISRTVTDAITVTRALGYRYLWVDQYCIPQNDEAKKKEQLELMGLIYQKSVLTIIAAGGNSAESGLPGVGSTPRAKMPWVAIQSTLESASQTPRIHTFAPALESFGLAEMEGSRWNTRAWTFQETILSRRRLIFTPAQVLFKCGVSSTQECIRETEGADLAWEGFDLPLVKDVSRRKEVSQIQYFENIVSDYVRRHLTFETDAYNAFLGMLEWFKSLPDPINNLYAIPMLSEGSDIDPNHVLSLGLCWRWYRHSFVAVRQQSHILRRKCFPSWSWIGWNNPDSNMIQWSHLPDLTALPFGRIFHCDAKFHVALSDDKILPWSTVSKDILKTYHDPTNIKYILIQATTFEAKISFSAGNYDSTKMGQDISYHYCNVHGFSADRHSIGLLLRTVEVLYYRESNTEPPSSVNLTFVVMNYVVERGSVIRVTMNAMVIGKLPNTEFYEKIGMLQLTSSFGDYHWQGGEGIYARLGPDITRNVQVRLV
ncbi:hypothetical protein BP6252_11289 [Coleophoma cylindrospora]|uniref:Heterokaryon incompatibility domain-containing protein n=1 Tax=Coleophoma cylindrospora TaxID=1849047 RepID=A0A3D8QQI3_9HELO|nr:hypothetical protein BP6252_11289 [Coleophoma cylindrospora]